MPSLNFPTPTTVGEQYLDWVWNGVGWDSLQTLPGGLPAGSIIQWGGSTAPVNWLLCDGSAVSRTTYASLFAAVGTSYGVGDGSTTFNLPDLRGRVPVGKNGGTFGTLGATGGAETVALASNEMPAHTHTFSATTSTDGSHSHGLSNGANNMVSDATSGINWATAGGGSYGFKNSTILSNGSHSHTVSGTTSSNGSGAAHNNLQPYQVVNYIIKATAAVTPGESELAGRVGALEVADATTNRSGLVPVVPTSVAVGSGSASVGANGLVSLTGVTSISLNGAFTSSYRHYRVVAKYRNASNNNTTAIQLRLRASSADLTSADWVFAGTNSVITSAGSVSINGWGAWGGNLCHFGYITPNFSHVIMDVFEPNIASTPTALSVVAEGANAVTGAHYSQSFNGGFNSGAVADGFTFFSGNTDTFTGTLQVYGYR